MEAALAARLKDAARLLAPAVAQTIAGLDLTGKDAAAVKLAEQYADVIDRSDGHCRGCEDPECRRAPASAWSMRWLGPLLLDCLAQLGATPAARAAMTKRGDRPGDAPKSRLQALRDARQA